MRKKYPEDVIKVYDLFLEYSEKVDALIQKLERNQQLFGKKIMDLMEPMGTDVADEEGKKG